MCSPKGEACTNNITNAPTNAKDVTRTYSMQACSTVTVASLAGRSTLVGVQG